LIKPEDYLVTLEIDGQMVSSEGLSEKMSSLFVSGVSKITFVIGGSVGLSDKVTGRADYHLSFSKMTFPHQLMRVILLEQIYRSFKISQGEPYHK
ncbi:MAG: 23S rRNA (pseudouridine(1915)-N(3))-methyltransferase RlmH, partial [Lachnospiraceae bacterium]|nr:23S rRNA (pseudouridine(1915)-N(3))-methyltransferase RlmH [Lachnospiraceae bacterium]